MITLPQSLGLSAVVMASILCLGGGATAACGIRGRGLDRLGPAVALGILALALVGAVVSLCGPAKQAVAAGLLLAGNLAGIAAWLRGRDDAAEGRWSLGQTAVAITAWCGLTMAATVAARTALPPAATPDGPYVFKENLLCTRIQALTGDLPCDNVLAHLVAEFLLRDIAFADERPILPGQEVTNRPILMAFAVVPFRAAFDPPPLLRAPLGRFAYVGRDWPDVRPLLADRHYAPFLAVAVVLNATPVVGLVWLLARRPLPALVVALAAAAFCSSYYVLNQTLFAWPKALCSFWIIAAVMATWGRLKPLPLDSLPAGRAAIAGGCLGVAAWCHPLAVVFAAALLAVQAAGLVRQRTRQQFETLLVTAASFVLVVAPWVIWSRLVVGIPPDLLAQNIGGGVGLEEAVANRVRNVWHVLVPAGLSASASSWRPLIATAWLSLPLSIGLVIVSLPLLQRLWIPSAQARSSVTAGPRPGVGTHLLAFGALPALLLCAVFGFDNPACLLHGFQFHVAAGVAAAVAWAWAQGGRAALPVIVAALLLQVAAHTAYARAKVAQDVPALFTNLAVRDDMLFHRPITFQAAPLPPNARVAVTVSGETRDCVWFNAPGVAVVGPVAVVAAEAAEVHVALHEHVWPIIPPEGITFRLTVRCGEEVVGVGSTTLSPAGQPAHRRWVPLRVPLGIHGSKQLTFALDMGPTAAPGNIDWCLWSGLGVIPE